MAYNLDDLDFDGAFSTDNSELFKDNLDVLTVDDISKVKMLNNSVLIEVENYLYDKIKTESGFELFADNTYRISDYAVRSGKIVNQVDKLTFWDEQKSGLCWKTEIQTEIGDTVWAYSMSIHSGEKLISKGKKYVICEYSDLYIAKRGEEVIPLNGNILLEPIMRTEKALLHEKKYIDPDYAKIAFTGLINQSYEAEYREDDPNLKKGMLVCISGIIPRRLEIPPYLHFDGKEYIVCQNYEIQGWLE